MKYILGFLFGALLIGCQTGLVEPDPTPPPPVVVTKYTITAKIIGQIGSVSPAETLVIKGSSASFSLALPLGYDPSFITVNGVKSALTSTTYSILSADTDMKLVFEIKMNRFGFLIWKPWKGLQERKRDFGTVEWGQASPLSFSFIFDNERFQRFNSITTLNATTLVGNGVYILTSTNDSLVIGPNPQGGDGIRNKIITLTGDSLVLRYVSKFFGSPKLPDTEIEERYIH